MQDFKFSKKHIASSFLVFIVCSSVGLILLLRFGQEKIDANFKIDFQTNNDIAKTELSKTNVWETSKGGVEKARGEMFRAAQAHEMIYLEDDKKSWARSRGYFNKEDFSLYASYDNVALWQLASQGDLLALAMWADALDKQGRRSDALQTEMTAAIYGSTASLTRLAAFHETKSWQESLSKAERLHQVKAMLVYAEVAAKRGDRNGIVSGLLELQRQGIELSKDDINHVSKAADSLLSQLEQQRNLLGLAPFDNEVDPLTEVQMDYMSSVLPNSNEWAVQHIGKAPEFFYIDVDEK